MEVLFMAKKEINPLIWEEIGKYPTSENVRSFIKEILLFERKHIDEKQPPYNKEYDKLIEKYSKEGGDKK